MVSDGIVAVLAVSMFSLGFAARACTEPKRAPADAGSGPAVEVCYEDKDGYGSALKLCAALSPGNATMFPLPNGHTGTLDVAPGAWVARKLPAECECECPKQQWRICFDGEEADAGHWTACYNAAPTDPDAGFALYKVDRKCSVSVTPVRP
jgi:hypothetical protein